MKGLPLISSLVIFCFCSCSDNPAAPTFNNIPAATAVPVINYSVTKYFPHDTTLFTEGFLFHDGQLFESTGSPNEMPQTKSMIGINDLATGKFTKKIE